LEFNASLKYKIYQQHFHKILTLNTKPYSFEYLESTEFEKIVEKIEQDKEKTVATKQKSIENFIESLEDPHTYLTNKEIETSLRANPPKTKVAYPMLKASILKSLIGINLDVTDLVMHEEEVLVKVNESVNLPHSDTTLSYTLELHIELEGLLESIWNAETLDFSELLQSAKKEHEESFFQ